MSVLDGIVHAANVYELRSNSTGLQLQVLHFDRSAVGVILNSATPYEQH